MSDRRTPLFVSFAPFIVFLGLYGCNINVTTTPQEPSETSSPEHFVQSEQSTKAEPVTTDATTDAAEVLPEKAPVPEPRPIVEKVRGNCELSVFPRKLVFDGPKTLRISIANIGNKSCMIHKIYIQSGGNGALSLLPKPKPRRIVHPSEIISFLLKFSPQKNGQYKDALIIESSDSDKPHRKIEIDAHT